MVKFKRIEGFENYLACSDGYILNSETGNILKPRVHRKTGYAEVTLYKDHKQKTKLVHRLIALSFFDGSDAQTEVNHIDGNKLNNRAENLEWVTRDENLRHAYEHGLMPNLTASTPVIATNMETGEQIEFSSIYSAAKFTHASQGNICSCCKGQRPYANGYFWHYKENDHGETIL